MVVDSDKELRVHQLAHDVVGLVRKGKRAPDGVARVLQLINDDPGFEAVLFPSAAVVLGSHQIDCDSDPFVPKNWKVESHTKGGTLIWDPSKLKLHFSPNQQNGKVIEGHKLRKELENEPVLNANVLDYLLKHPELIPEDWEEKYIFFWGTIYRDSDGDLCVRCLDWDDGRWYWDCFWLGGDWGASFPAVVRASL